MPLTLLVWRKEKETKGTDAPQSQPKVKSQCLPTAKPERIRRTKCNSKQTEITSQTHEAKNKATSRKKTNSIILPALLPTKTLRIQQLLVIHTTTQTSFSREIAQTTLYLRREIAPTKQSAKDENTNQREKRNASPKPSTFLKFVANRIEPIYCNEVLPPGTIQRGYSENHVQ